MQNVTIIDLQDIARRFWAPRERRDRGGEDPAVRPRDEDRDRDLLPDAAPTVRLLINIYMP